MHSENRSSKTQTNNKSEDPRSKHRWRAHLYWSHQRHAQKSQPETGDAGKTPLPDSIQDQLYLIAVLRHLTYCQTVWHFCKHSDRKKLERVQERALRVLRVILDSKTDSNEDLLRRAKLPSLYSRQTAPRHCDFKTFQCTKLKVAFPKVI